MVDQINLVIFETESIPEGYKALAEMTADGLEPLEFYPHARGVRILFRSEKPYVAKTKQAESFSVTHKILKAFLSQTGTGLKKYLAAVEADKVSTLLKLANDFEKMDAEILEIRSLRSNPEKNYALFSFDEKEKAESFLKNFDHAILESSNPALKNFLLFS